MSLQLIKISLSSLSRPVQGDSEYKQARSFLCWVQLIHDLLPSVNMFRLSKSSYAHMELCSQIQINLKCFVGGGVKATSPRLMYISPQSPQIHTEVIRTQNPLHIQQYSIIPVNGDHILVQPGIPVIPALKRQRQEDKEFKARLSCLNSKLA